MENNQFKCQSVLKKPMGAFLFILAVNAIVWAMALCFGVHFEESDDPMIALMLRNSGDYYCAYVGGGMRWFIHQLFRLSPTVEWWMISSVAFSAIGISACVYSLIRKHPNKRGMVLGGGILIIGWFMSVNTVNFTRTAMVVAMGGVSLILTAIAEGSSRKSIWMYVLGFLFLIIGGQIRVKAGFLSLVFLALGGLIYLVRQNEVFKKSWWCKNRKAIALLTVSAIAFTGVAYLDAGMKTDREKEIDSYNAVRASIQDYSHKYEGLLNSDELCRSIGLSSANDVTMFINWMNDDREVFTKEQLTKIAEVKDEDSLIDTAASAIKKMIKIFVLSPMGILMPVVSAVLLLKNFKKNLFPVSLTFFISTALLFYLCFRGRNPARVYDAILFAAIWMILYFSDHTGFRFFAGFPVEILLCVLMIAAVYAKAPKTDKITPFNERKIQSEMSYRNYELINEKKDSIYFSTSFIYGTFIKSSTWTLPPEDFCDNLIPIGGWTVHASSIIDQKEKYGVDNSFRDLLEKENAYLIFDEEHEIYYGFCEQILRYLQEHYDASATMERLDDIGTFSVVRYRSGS